MTDVSASARRYSLVKAVMATRALGLRRKPLRPGMRRHGRCPSRRPPRAPPADGELELRIDVQFGAHVVEVLAQPVAVGNVATPSLAIALMFAVAADDSGGSSGRTWAAR